MNVVATIQARVGSTRLPGKVLKKINDKPMLLYQIERVRRSRLLDDIVVATSTNPLDNAIVELCRNNGVRCFRGSENDVLSRIASAIQEFNIDIHVELFGDCPLPDAHLIDEVIGYYLKFRNTYDYVSNSIKTTYPPGQEVAVYRGSALLEADAVVSKSDPLREHCSLNITRLNDRFRICNLEAPPYYHYPDIYLEVDTPEDLEFISLVIDNFARAGYGYFSLAQILDFINRNKELTDINNKVDRRWKEFRE